MLSYLSCWRTTGSGKASVKYMSMSPAQLGTYITLPGVQSILDGHSTLMRMRLATPIGQPKSALPGVMLLMHRSRPTIFILFASSFVAYLPLQCFDNLQRGHLLSWLSCHLDSTQFHGHLALLLPTQAAPKRMVYAQTTQGFLHRQMHAY